jgi:phosphatidylglycerophosphate synthase
LAPVTRQDFRNGFQPERPRRPREMQDPLNHYLYHPLAWQLALRLARSPLTPNMVSVIGAGCVVAAAVAYAQPSWLPAWPLSALLGMMLHMAWHVVDGADGDLARITGRTSPIGEMVDGLCDYLSHIVLYLVLGWLLDRQIGHIAWFYTVAAGLSHIVQSNHVEVQRRQYQWWVYGTPWLRNTHKEGSATAQSGFGALVSAYLAIASGMTPHALKVDAAVADAAVADAAERDPARLERIRAAVRAEATPLLRLCKLLGPNPRAIVLGLSMLAGSPIFYFFYQAVVLNLLLAFSVVRHNQAAERIARQIED